MNHSKYFWPASAIAEEDMVLLYRAREGSSPHVPITQLLARAVRQTYGHLAVCAEAAADDEQQQKAA